MTRSLLPPIGAFDVAMASVRTAGSFVFADLQRAAGGPNVDHNVAAEVCTKLRRDGFVVVQHSEAFVQVAQKAQAAVKLFFQHPQEEKLRLAPLIDPKSADGGCPYGYKNHGSREFIEARSYTNSDGEKIIVPTLGRSEKDPKDLHGFNKAVGNLHSALESTANLILRLIAVYLNLPADFFAQLLSPTVEGDAAAPSDTLDSEIDNPSTAAQEKLTTSVMRICNYDPCSGSSPSGTVANFVAEDVADVDPVAFGEHTDTTFITCGTVAEEPGLEVAAGEKWLPIETMFPPHRSVVVLVGEYLHLLTKGSMAATRHRVMRPVDNVPRISFPLLIRGYDEQTINTTQYIEAADTSVAEDATGAINETLPPCELMKCNGVRLRALHVRVASCLQHMSACK